VILTVKECLPSVSNQLISLASRETGVWGRWVDDLMVSNQLISLASREKVFKDKGSHIFVYVSNQLISLASRERRVIKSRGHCQSPCIVSNQLISLASRELPF
jgi:hypothetical protein